MNAGEGHVPLDHAVWGQEALHLPGAIQGLGPWWVWAESRPTSG